MNQRNLQYKIKCGSCGAFIEHAYTEGPEGNVKATCRSCGRFIRFVDHPMAREAMRRQMDEIKWRTPSPEIDK